MFKRVAIRAVRRKPDPLLAAQRREDILHAAAHLFAELGYANTDTQMLADKLGVGKGTLYRYFPSKQDLFLAAVDRVMVHLRQKIDASIVGVADPLQQIARAVEAYLVFFAEHPGYVELLMQERAQFKDRKQHTYFAHRESNLERWKQMYRDLITAGRIRDVPVERITDVFGQLMYGTIFVNFFTGKKVPPAEQARDIMDVVFHGILTDVEKTKRS